MHAQHAHVIVQVNSSDLIAIMSQVIDAINSNSESSAYTVSMLV